MITELSKKEILIVLVSIGAIFVAGRYSAVSNRAIDKSNETKLQNEKSTDKNQNLTVTEKETRLPDGTVIKEHIQQKQTEIKEIKTETKLQETEAKTTINRSNFRIGLIYEPPIPTLQPERYKGLLEVRLIGEIYGGLSIGATNGLVLSIGF